jgi:hypothetical protein
MRRTEIKPIRSSACIGSVRKHKAVVRLHVGRVLHHSTYEEVEVVGALGLEPRTR